MTQLHGIDCIAATRVPRREKISCDAARSLRPLAHYYDKERSMKPGIFDNRGVPLEKQVFTWRDLVQKPISKLDDDAYTRVRIILMNGIENEAMRFSHACARMNKALQRPLAEVRRVEHHQATLINWLIGPDHSPLETTIAYEQVAIDVTAAVAQNEPDSYLAQVYRFGLLEDFDHMYRYSALLDRLEGKDANNILQSYTDILPGRPTVDEHRHPADDLRRPYDRRKAAPITKLHALTIMAAEQQTHNFYMNIGPMYADPVARQLYAEIASIEEQHVTQYESIIDPEETWLEKWVMHEASEVYNYFGCMEQESNPRIRALWERFLDYELGHLNLAMELLQKHEKRDATELLPETLPAPIPFDSQREFVRKTLANEVDLRTDGTEFVPKSKESELSLKYRRQINADGSPSELVSAGYKWAPGSELKLKAA
jgi:rubrerythrin